MNLLKHLILCMIPFVALVACSSSSKSNDNETTEVDSTYMDFNADSALSFVKSQCDFGPRVPNTEAHRKCGDFLIAQLQKYSDNVIVQEAKLNAFDGTVLNARNIIAEFNPDSVNGRILLLAHWDCRPWADRDPDPDKRRLPVMGANDGASGVGVLLEMARQFSMRNPGVGIDILLVDAEDWGNSDTSADDDGERTWALGTQYWVANKHRENYNPAYGILLDMVGARNANFSKEYYSISYALSVVNNVWGTAQRSGFGQFFSQQNGGAVTDDHVFVNRGGIPCIDIIDYKVNSETGFFAAWHTTFDTFDAIDPLTLKAVGQTLTNLIYKQ